MVRKEKNKVLTNIKTLLKDYDLGTLKEFTCRSETETIRNIFIPFTDFFSKLPSVTLKLLSFNIYLITKDKKLVVCERHCSFVYYFFNKELRNIKTTTNFFVKENYKKLMLNITPVENQILRRHYDTETLNWIKDEYGEIKTTPNFKEWILPGGKFDKRDDYNLVSTLLRELQEECQIINNEFAIFQKLVCYSNIFDVVVKKYFHCFSFLMFSEKRSDEILQAFTPNKEIRSISFITLGKYSSTKNTYNNRLEIFKKIVSEFLLEVQKTDFNFTSYKKKPMVTDTADNLLNNKVTERKYLSDTEVLKKNGSTNVKSAKRKRRIKINKSFSSPELSACHNLPQIYKTKSFSDFSSQSSGSEKDSIEKITFAIMKTKKKNTRMNKQLVTYYPIKQLTYDHSFSFINKNELLINKPKVLV